LHSFAKTLLEKPATAKRDTPISQLPDTLRKALEDAIRVNVRAWVVSRLNRELQRCYGSKITELASEFHAEESFRIEISEDNPYWEMHLTSTKNKLQVKKFEFDLSSLTITSRISRGLLRQLLAKPTEKIERDELSYYLFNEIVENILANMFAAVLPDSYYLPAARSGFLQSHRQLASSVMRISPLVGIERLEIPRLPGVITDFISTLLTLTKDSKTGLYKVGRFLEREILHGVVDMQEQKTEYPEIFYKPHKRKFPIHRTSSMVSELAPVILFTKYVAQPADFLIIEEPESHLHPQSQRQLARAIVKLIRAGAKILITTHSDYFVHQLNNFLMMGKVPKQGRSEQGYSVDDYLKVDEVAAYLFDLNLETGASIVKDLVVSVEEGISEENFAMVYEALHHESVYLQRKLPL
jgi:predicted ATPase